MLPFGNNPVLYRQHLHVDFWVHNPTRSKQLAIFSSQNLSKKKRLELGKLWTECDYCDSYDMFILFGPESGHLRATCEKVPRGLNNRDKKIWSDGVLKSVYFYASLASKKVSSGHSKICSVWVFEKPITLHTSCLSASNYPITTCYSPAFSAKLSMKLSKCLVQLGRGLIPKSEWPMDIPVTF